MVFNQTPSLLRDALHCARWQILIRDTISAQKCLTLCSLADFSIKHHLCSECLTLCSLADFSIKHHLCTECLALCIAEQRWYLIEYHLCSAMPYTVLAGRLLNQIPIPAQNALHCARWQTFQSNTISAQRCLTL